MGLNEDLGDRENVGDTSLAVARARAEREAEDKKQGFTVLDKRGQNNPIQEKPQPEPTNVDMRPVEERHWDSEDYIIVLNKANDGGPLVIGRAIGLANDGNTFYADYLFAPRWRKGLDWTVDAKRRLDTFLQCSCSPKTGPCPYHRRATNGGWLKEDNDRIREDGDRPASKALEVYFKAENARQQAQRILAPRR